MPRKRTKRQYFTKVHEDAIVQYCLSKDRFEKEKMYGELIHPAFDELVDKIVFTYKFTTLPNIDSLREECKAWFCLLYTSPSPRA